MSLGTDLGVELWGFQFIPLQTPGMVSGFNFSHSDACGGKPGTNKREDGVSTEEVWE